MRKQLSLGRKVGMLGTAAALAAVTAIPVATAAQDDAEIRVLHGADAPAVDIYANGNLTYEGLEFTQDSGYLAVPGGDYQIQVVPTGAGLDDPANIVVDATVPFEGGTKTTVVATGSLDTGIVPQLVLDTPEPSADMTQVKVGHMSYDAPAVDVAPDGADPLITELTFPNVEGYLTVPGGAYDLEVRLAGTEDVAIQLPELMLENGVSYSVYAIGGATSGTLTAVPLVDADIRQANVRVGHFSPDAGLVDIYANGAILAGLEGVDFGAITSYLEVPPGDYQIQVAPTGAGADAAVIDAVLTFGPGTWTTVAAANNVAAIEALVFDDAAPVPAEGVAKLRAYHASADAPTKVDIATDGAAKKKAVVKKLKFGKNTGFLELEPGDLDLDIREVGKKKVLLDIDPLGLEAGTVYSAFAVTSPDGVTVIPNIDAEADAN